MTLVRWVSRRIIPEMVSFLGVPIRAGDLQLGQIYLTNKLDDSEFTEDDERIIQMLAGYAAAAIQNARLVDEMTRRDKALTRRSEDLIVAERYRFRPYRLSRTG